MSMMLAQTVGGGTLADVYFNPEVLKDWEQYIRDEGKRGYVSYAEWCGIEPCRWDRDVVWC